MLLFPCVGSAADVKEYDPDAYIKSGVSDPDDGKYETIRRDGSEGVLEIHVSEGEDYSSLQSMLPTSESIRDALIAWNRIRIKDFYDSVVAYKMIPFVLNLKEKYVEVDKSAKGEFEEEGKYRPNVYTYYSASVEEGFDPKREWFEGTKFLIRYFGGDYPEWVQALTKKENGDFAVGLYSSEMPYIDDNYENYLVALHPEAIQAAQEGKPVQIEAKWQVMLFDDAVFDLPTDAPYLTESDAQQVYTEWMLDMQSLQANLTEIQYEEEQ